MSANEEFTNPEHLPVEQLSLPVTSGGVLRLVKALDPHWVEKREWRTYLRLPTDKSVMGVVEAWTSSTICLLEDLKYLLTLRHHKFWSHIIHSPRCMDAVVSFLQDVEPPYVTWQSPLPPVYNEVRIRVASVFCRIVTERESDTEWMSREYLGRVMYDKYLLSIPTLWDLCLAYGMDNSHAVSRMVHAAFTLQPRFTQDLETAVAFVQEVFKYTIMRVNNKYATLDPPNLPQTFQGFSDIKRPTSDNSVLEKLTLSVLNDLVLNILDTVLTLRIFIEVYSPAVEVLKKRGFILSLVQLYENAIPAMYEHLYALGTDGSPGLAAEIDERLEVARGEMLDVVRHQLAFETDAILSDQGDKEKHVSDYLAAMMDVLSEKTLARDYSAVYPVHDDLEMLRQAYPDMDSVKIDFILQAIYSNLDDPDLMPTTSKLHTSNDIPQTSAESNQKAGEQPSEVDIPSDLKEESLIREVKDILPHLGEGFILKCLQHYGFNSERVINSILEGTLDASLQSLDQSLPIIPPDPLDQKFLETGIERLNIFDGDQFDIMTRDDVDLTRIHVGKKKEKFKDLKQMLDDKSHVKQRMDLYTKYSLITEDEDMYSDEYDDTYDSAAPGVRDGFEEVRRPTVRPRVLQQMEPDEESSSEEEPEAASSSAPAPPGGRGRGTKPLDFCVNPEMLRARREANRRANQKPGRAPPPKVGDVVGRAKGQGQEAEVLRNREKKAEHKSSRANHNRRQGAQWKRSQGMMPS